jgi:hypothetical protein
MPLKSFIVHAPEALLYKSSCLAPALGVTKFINITQIFWLQFVMLLKPDLDVHQPRLLILQNLIS